MRCFVHNQCMESLWFLDAVAHNGNSSQPYTMHIHVTPETGKTHCSTTKSDPVKSTATDRAEHQKCKCCLWLDTAANKAMQDLIVNKWGSASNWSKLQHIVKILSSATARSCSSLERGQLLYANHVQNKSKHHLCMPSAPETATSK